MKRTLRSISGFVNGRLLGRKVPLKVQHFVTLRCNLRCRYCGLWREKTPELSTDEVKDMIRDLAAMGAVSWTFTGGEPLLRTDIKELVECAKSNHMIVTLTTNGKLVGENLDWIGVADMITISLDGAELTHDNNRGMGSFKVATDAIRSLKGIGANVVVGAVLSKDLTRNGCAGLKSLLALVEEYDVKALFLPMYNDSFNKDHKMEDIMPDEAEYSQSVRILRRFKAKGGGRLMMSGPALDWVADFHAMRTMRCFAGRLLLTIYPDGSMATCMFKQETRTAKGTPRERFMSLPTFDMCACKANCYVESNNLLALRPDTILDFLRQLPSMGRRR